MKFLVDNALSPVVSTDLCLAGFDAVHVRDYNLETAPDEIVFDLALKEKRVLVSADTDFGTLLALSQQTSPSVILFRHEVEREPKKQVSLLTDNLPKIKEALETGSVVVFEPARIRIRSLPIS